jgi:hypothetical protein
MDFYSRREWLDKKSAVEYFKTLVKMNASISTCDERLIDNIGPMEDTWIEKHLERWPIKVLAENSFIRGTMNSILVRFPGSLVDSDSTFLYSETDVFDIFRLKGTLEKAEDHWEQIPGVLRRRYTADSPVFVADSFERRPYPRIALSRDSYARWITAVFQRDDTSIKSGDPRTNEVLNRVLEERNLVFFWRGMNRLTDYRIPRLYAEGENGAAVIGDWALVAEYLYKKQKAKDRQKHKTS